MGGVPAGFIRPARPAAIASAPGGATCSVNIRIEDGIGPAAELAAAYGEAGADLAIMNLPLNADPGLLAPLAAALEPLAG